VPIFPVTPPAVSAGRARPEVVPMFVGSSASPSGGPPFPPSRRGFRDRRLTGVMPPAAPRPPLHDKTLTFVWRTYHYVLKFGGRRVSPGRGGPSGFCSEMDGRMLRRTPRALVVPPVLSIFSSSVPPHFFPSPAGSCRATAAPGYKRKLPGRGVGSLQPVGDARAPGLLAIPRCASFVVNVVPQPSAHCLRRADPWAGGRVRCPCVRPPLPRTTSTSFRNLPVVHGPPYGPVGGGPSPGMRGSSPALSTPHARSAVLGPRFTTRSSPAIKSFPNLSGESGWPFLLSAGPFRRRPRPFCPGPLHRSRLWPAWWCSAIRPCTWLVLAHSYEPEPIRHTWPATPPGPPGAPGLPEGVRLRTPK